MVKRSIDQKLRSRNFEASNERIEIGAVIKNRRGQRGVERVPGDCWQKRAKKTVFKKKSCCFRTMRISVQDRHQRPLFPLKHRQKRMVEILREKGLSEGPVHLGGYLDNRPEITSKVSAPRHLVIFGILPKVECHGKLRTKRYPWFIDKLFKLSYTNISNISVAGRRPFRINKK